MRSRPWGKPVKYQLIADAGFDFYQQMLSIRAGEKEKLAPCLKKLVPIMQQAQVGFMPNDPASANKLILELVNKYNNGWTYPARASPTTA